MTQDYAAGNLTSMLAQVKKNWRGRLQIVPDGAFTKGCQIADLPAACAECFDRIPEENLQLFTLACCLYSDGIVVADNAIDSADGKHRHRITDMMMLIAESYRIFGALFAADDEFWQHHRRYFIEYVDAMRSEAELSSGARDWRSTTLDDCMAIVRGKNGLCRIVAAGVCSLARDYDLLYGLEEGILACFTAIQMIDDVRDWPQDIEIGNISLLLRSACDTRPLTAEIETVRRRLYLDGHVANVLGVGVEIVESALHQLPRKAKYLTALLERSATYLGSLQNDLVATRREQVAAASTVTSATKGLEHGQ